MSRINFDLDVLRSFVTGVELGSFAQAADKLGRSTSAISAQLKKLEEQAGTPVLRKSGRGLALTPMGELLLAYARRLLELNDEAATALRGIDLAGSVRIGMQEDFGENLLTRILGDFVRAHPKVRIETRVTRSTELLSAIRNGQLDLALAWDGGERTPHCETLRQLPMRWIGPSLDKMPALAAGEPVPLVMFEAPCLMRSTAIAALDRARISWRIAFTSSSLSGIWSAVNAGLGVTVRTRTGLPPSLRMLEGMPALPQASIVLHSAEATPAPAVRRLAEIVRATLDLNV
jgi:DNA-binding transcriptional LysR family regulator